MTDDSPESDSPTYDMETYLEQIRNTVYAAYDDYAEREVINRIEGLLFEFREDHDPRIDSQEAFESELDALIRDAYLPTAGVIEALDAKADELRTIGEDAPSFPLEREESDGERSRGGNGVSAEPSGAVEDGDEDSEVDDDEPTDDG